MTLTPLVSKINDTDPIGLHRPGQRYQYELLYDGDGKACPHANGLIDVDQLKACAYDGRRSGQKAKRSGAGQPVVRPRSGGGQTTQSGDPLSGNKGLTSHSTKQAENAYPACKNTGPSYPQTPPLAARAK